MRKTTCKAAVFLLAAALALSVSATTKANAAHPDAEIARAVKYGFVPSEIQKDYEKQITYKQMCQMLTKLISINRKDVLPKWNKSAKLAIPSNRPMLRSDGALALCYAAYALDLPEVRTPGTDAFTFFTYSWTNNYTTMMNTNHPDGHGVGDKVFEITHESELSWDWDLFPQWDKVSDTALFTSKDNASNDSITLTVCVGSLISLKSIYDYDTVNNSAHYDKPLTRGDAIRAVLRLGEAEPDILGLTAKDLEKTRTTADIDKTILQNAEKRKKSILENTTAVKYAGTAYYVSNKGDDKNDGRTQKTAWATLDKVNAAKDGTLKSGDAVFFERGGLWRGYIKCAEGVTYSAYGTGDKPKIYGSQESGVGVSKWKLWYEKGGVKIWKFYRDITEVGNIVFNGGDSHAIRVYDYYNGKKWVVSYEDQRPFDVKEQLREDLMFYSTFDLPEKLFNKYKEDAGGWNGVVFTDMIDTTGALYLRCDKGNPGSLYKEVEFHNLPADLRGYVGLVQPSGHNIIDNLCIMYSLCEGVSIYYDESLSTKEARNKSNTHNTIQNCEIAWCGGEYHVVNSPYHDVIVCGETVTCKTSNNTFRNNYVHQSGGGPGFTLEYVQNDNEAINENNTIEGNLVERCNMGFILGWSFEGIDMPFVRNIKIIDNYFIYTGYSWRDENDLRISPPGNPYYSVGRMCLWFSYEAAKIKNMSIKGNVFYLAHRSPLIRFEYDTYDISFADNVYIQNANDKLINIDTPTAQKDTFGYYYSANQALKVIQRVFGDKTAKVY